MVWLIIVGFIAIIVATVVLGIQIDYTNNNKLFWLYVPLALMFWLLVLFAYNKSLDYQANKCAKWSIETGYETKYKNVGYGDWNCYGKTNGKWLPIERIRGIED